MDDNALHGPSLSGEKILSCWIEKDDECASTNLVYKIREIKRMTGSRFQDVVLSAISTSLYKYFEQTGKEIPRKLTVVIPTRMEPPQEQLSLRNCFSVGLLSLGISDDCCNSDGVKRLRGVTASHKHLRDEDDYLINFWVMKWFSAILPEGILRPILKSHSTLIFSNLPGPRLVRIAGRWLKNVAFWIPNRGTSGIGCSALTYGGLLHMSIAADKAVVDSEEVLATILQNTVNEILNLYETLTLSNFSRSFKEYRVCDSQEKGYGASLNAKVT